MTNLFSAKTWAGQFFVPGHFEGRFQGTLSYSPESGVLLTYRVDADNVPSVTEALHGVLDNGDMCTLFGNFSIAGAGSTVRNGLQTINGKRGFKMLAIGGFLPPDIETDNISFMLSGLQDFFYPVGRAKFRDNPVESIYIPVGELEVLTAGNFDVLSADITDDVYSRNEPALSALSDAYREVQEKFPDAHFLMKKKVEYTLRLKLNKPNPIVSCYSHIADICNLFSVLLSTPTYPEQVTVSIRNDEEFSTRIEIYPSLGLNAETIRICQRSRHFSDLPITAADLPLDPTIKKWMADPERHSVLVSAIQHEVGFRTEHTAHGDAVLYASQLESISYAAGHKKDKYEYAILRFGTPKLLTALESVLGESGSAAVGIAVGDIRNEIAHVGRPRTRLANIKLAGLMKFSYCLQLVVAANALESITVPRDVVQRYVDKLLP